MPRRNRRKKQRLLPLLASAKLLRPLKGSRLRIRSRRRKQRELMKSQISQCQGSGAQLEVPLDTALCSGRSMTLRERRLSFLLE